MRSKKDQIQAHSYVVSRLKSALVHGEPDAAQSPLRRTGLGVTGGLILSVLIVVGFVIWGAVKPATSSASPLKAGELVVVSGTGSRYIYDGHKLRPVLNWSSALLLTDGQATMTTVSAATAAAVPQGQPAGLAGAPDSLPAASAINKGWWLACSQAGGVSVNVGVSRQGTPVPATDAAVVTAGGAAYLLWHGERLQLDSGALLSALGLSRAPVIPVSVDWLTAVQAGPDLVALSVPGSGGAGPVLAGGRTKVGEVLLEQNVGSASQYFVVMPGGIAPVSLTQAAILLTTATGASSPVGVSPAAVASARQVSSGLADGAGAPATPPSGYAPARGVPCVSYAAAGGQHPSLVFASPPPGSPPPLATPGVTASPDGASMVSVAPGSGALVAPQTVPGAGVGSYFLVTSPGVKFAVPAAYVTELGYRSGAAAALPATLLALLPTGPALDLQPLGG